MIRQTIEPKLGDSLVDTAIEATSLASQLLTTKDNDVLVGFAFQNKIMVYVGPGASPTAIDLLTELAIYEGKSEVTIKLEDDLTPDILRRLANHKEAGSK